MAATSAERVRAYRARRKVEGLEDTTRRNRPAERKAYDKRKRSRPRPFVGCDGEGAGHDESGRQNYVLYRQGERELWAKGRRLQTAELLDFICDEPAGNVLVGFAFGYDVTMILRDLPAKQQARLFEPRDFSSGKSRYTWYRDFNVEYLPKNYLRVCRVEIQHYVAEGREMERRKIVKGSTRTIFETFGFFQKSFVKAVDDFAIAHPDQMKQLKASKAKRGDDDWKIDQTERDYCALECQLLAELMEKLRDYCVAAEIYPRTWSGAGKLAKAIHAREGTITRKEVEEIVPQGPRDFAQMAYYGGRFEVTRIGFIPQKVYEYDIRSAYPDAMRGLPCLRHGEWKRATAGEIRGHEGLYVAAVTFNRVGGTDGPGRLGGLPIRAKDGRLSWPNQGGGVYWSPEIESAERLGFQVRKKGGWTYHKRCDCEPFGWVEPLYDYRRSIGSSGPGYPIKLGINSLYGLLAQRKGNGKYTNMIWAGLITALTRAKLNAAILEAGEANIIMMATDGVYSLVPLPGLDEGERLGQWESVTLDGLFIVQPGLYWCPAKRKRKSRGLSGKFFEEDGRTEAFEDAWTEFRLRDRAVADRVDGDPAAPADPAFDAGRLGGDPRVPFPRVAVPVPGFIGLRLALARGKPEVAGTWISDTREIDFDYRGKRTGHAWVGDPEAGQLVTGIKPGGPTLISLPHRDFLAAGGAEPWEGARMMLDEQPDYVDLGIPFGDD